MMNIIETRPYPESNISVQRKVSGVGRGVATITVVGGIEVRIDQLLDDC